MKEAELLPMRIDDQCDLPRFAEEVAMDKQVVRREEDAEVGMRVMSAEDNFVRELFIDVACQASPSFVRES